VLELDFRKSFPAGAHRDLQALDVEYDLHRD
jgi:hypothetical protein